MELFLLQVKLTSVYIYDINIDGGVMRQTTLSLAEIKEYLESRQSKPYPRCLVVNEAGDIAQNTIGRESSEAQDILVSLLDSEYKNDRYISIRHLIDIRNKRIATNRTICAINEFILNTENVELVPRPNESSIN